MTDMPEGKTNRSRTIRRAAFIAVLAAWPVAMYVVRQHDWGGNAELSVEVALFSSAMFFTACVIALRSWVIGGVVIGLCVGAFAPDASFAIVLATFGVLFGLAMEDRSPKKRRPVRHA